MLSRSELSLLNGGTLTGAFLNRIFEVCMTYEKQLVSFGAMPEDQHRVLSPLIPLSLIATTHLISHPLSSHYKKRFLEHRTSRATLI
jgi:hypothetical protein